MKKFLIAIGIPFTLFIFFLVNISIGLSAGGGLPPPRWRTEEILGRQHIRVPVGQKIRELQSELIVQRSLRTMKELPSNSSWQKFRQEAYKFPAFQAIPPAYNKMSIDWTRMNYKYMDEFVVMVTDQSRAIPAELLVHSDFIANNDWGVFLIREHYDTEDALYGPFFADDINRLIDEINVGNG